MPTAAGRNGDADARRSGAADGRRDAARSSSPVRRRGAPPDPAASSRSRSWQRTAALPANRSIRTTRPSRPTASRPATSTPGLIGPIGYDVQK